VQRLNQEAAKSSSAGLRAGLAIERGTALSWITSNAAWVLGVDGQTGSLEPGKMADVVVWSRDPLSVYAQVDQVFIDGRAVYERDADGRRPSDFELGQGAEITRRKEERRAAPNPVKVEPAPGTGTTPAPAAAPPAPAAATPPAPAPAPNPPASGAPAQEGAQP
jgi:hypothetical protein